MITHDQVIDWDTYFLLIAEAVAMRSPDPKRKVGCVVVDPATHHIVSGGYNGTPPGFDDSTIDWRMADDKDAFVVHAELNALVNAERSLAGCILYTTYSPCAQCAKLLAAARIIEVHCIELESDERGTRALIDHFGIKVINHG